MAAGDKQLLFYRVTFTAATGEQDLAAEIDALDISDVVQADVALQVYETDQVIDLVEATGETTGLTCPVVAAADENFALWSGPLTALLGGSFIVPAADPVTCTLLIIPLN